MAAILDLIKIKGSERFSEIVESKRRGTFDEWSEIGFKNVEIRNHQKMIAFSCL